MIDVDSLSEDECRSVLAMMGWTHENRDKRMPLFNYKSELKFQFAMRETIQKLKDLQHGNHT